MKEVAQVQIDGNQSEPVKGKAPAGQKVTWAVESEKEEHIQPEIVILKPNPKAYADVLGNRVVDNGWKLKYTPPKEKGVVFSVEEWDKGSKEWETALVGYVVGR